MRIVKLRILNSANSPQSIDNVIGKTDKLFLIQILSMFKEEWEEVRTWGF